MKLYEILQPLFESEAKFKALANKYSASLLSKLNSDSTIPPRESQISNIKTDWFFQMMKDESDPNFDIHEAKVNLIKEFAKFYDPTPNNKYLDWIIRSYLNDDYRIEDNEMIFDYLKTFHENKNLFDIKDINQYKTFTDLKNTIDPLKSTTDNILKSKLIQTKDAKMIYNSGDIKIIIPHTYDAAKVFSQGTEWCTQYPKMYQKYSNKGDLYIVETKNPEDRYQVHFESNQIMDIHDKPVIDAVSKNKEFKWLCNYHVDRIKSGEVNITDQSIHVFTQVDKSLITVDDYIKILVNSDVEEEISIDDILVYEYSNYDESWYTTRTLDLVTIANMIKPKFSGEPIAYNSISTIDHFHKFITGSTNNEILKFIEILLDENKIKIYKVAEFMRMSIDTSNNISITLEELWKLYIGLEKFIDFGYNSHLYYRGTYYAYIFNRELPEQFYMNTPPKEIGKVINLMTNGYISSDSFRKYANRIKDLNLTPMEKSDLQQGLTIAGN